MRNLHLILGDQLDADSAVFDGFDADVDRLWMAEVHHEATHIWCHKLRIAFFFSAMRHFRDEQREQGRKVEYHALQADARHDSGTTFGDVLRASINRLKPERLIVVEPGDWRVREELQQTADQCGLPREVRADRHFYCSIDEFNDYATGRKNLVLEYFYREMRKRHSVLIDDDGEPVGGAWNFDHDNRESFSREGPGKLPQPLLAEPDTVTQDVLRLVGERFRDHPGSLDHFTLPVTRTDARRYLRHFIEHTLPNFGRWEDAMWTGEPFLYHSRLSALLNVKLLHPRECVEAAVAAWERGDAPINSVEGFVRQILGWREFIRGVYWREMPDYIGRNALEHEADLPRFYWDGETDMRCMREAMQHVLRHGYTHHIERLMVLGNLALLLGVHPRTFHEWHMAMYLDAVDWVSLPNTLGMSQFGDSGIVGTKPYCASGHYVNKMSNYCRGCRYNYKESIGADACPVTTLYWDFLDRHRNRFADNRRMTFQLKNLERKSLQELSKIREQAASIKDRAARGERL